MKEKIATVAVCAVIGVLGFGVAVVVGGALNISIASLF